jgi:hypothetical protein
MQVQAIAGGPASQAAVSAAPLSAADWLAYCRHSGRHCDARQQSAALSEAEIAAYALWLSGVTGRPYRALPAGAVKQEKQQASVETAGAHYLALSRE